MKSVKNLFVCVMLLGVSYGAYQVIKTPEPDLGDQDVEMIDIQIGEESISDPSELHVPSNILAGDSGTSDNMIPPLPSSAQSIPPMPRDFSQSVAESQSQTAPPVLEIPDLQIPEIDQSPSGSNTSSKFQKNDSLQNNDTSNGGSFTGQLTPPAFHAPARDNQTTLIPPPLAPLKDPGAFQPSPVAAQPSDAGAFVANSNPPTTGFNASSFDPTPETQLTPVNPKPEFDATPPAHKFVPEPAINTLNTARENVTNALAETTNRTKEVVREQIQNRVVEPYRDAEAMLNQGTEQLMNGAGGLINKSRDQAGELAGAVRDNATRIIDNIQSGIPAKTARPIDWSGINNLAQNGNTQAALRQLSAHYNDDLPQDQRMQMLSWLDLLAGKVIYSTEHLLAPQPHVVRNGESIQSIAQSWNIPAQLVLNVNQSKIGDPDNLIPGTELKRIQGPFNAIVNVQRQELTLFLSDMYAGRFPIELGQDGNGIPHGSFMVEQKLPGREYVGTNGKRIAAGALENPYGKYWIGLNDTLAIHEFNPTSGVQDNRGSIRVSSRDAADIFGILSSGSQVTVTR